MKYNFLNYNFKLARRHIFSVLYQPVAQADDRDKTDTTVATTTMMQTTQTSTTAAFSSKFSERMLKSSSSRNCG
jgi:hypothetical protein